MNEIDILNYFFIIYSFLPKEVASYLVLFL